MGRCNFFFLNRKDEISTNFWRNSSWTACWIDIFFYRIFVSVFRRWGCCYSGMREQQYPWWPGAPPASHKLQAVVMRWWVASERDTCCRKQAGERHQDRESVSCPKRR